MATKLFTFLALVLFFCNRGRSEQSFATSTLRHVSARDIPVRILQHHLSHPLHDSKLLRNTAYELAKGNVIKGHVIPQVRSVAFPGTPKCGALFTAKKALVCIRKTLSRVVIADENGRIIGRLSVKLEISNGAYLVIFSAGRRAFFRDVEARVCTTPGLLKGTPLTVESGNRVVNVIGDANNWPVPPLATSCCRKPLYVAYAVSVCRAFRTGTACVKIDDTFTKTVRCRNVCRGHPHGASFFPMSATNKCPICSAI